MKPQKAFWWLLFLTFATGFMFGQDHPDAVVIRGLFLFVMAIFVLHTLLNCITGTYAIEQEDQWKGHPSPRKTRQSSKGMAATVAAAARATGTHVTVLEPEKPQASSDEPPEG